MKHLGVLYCYSSLNGKLLYNTRGLYYPKHYSAGTQKYTSVETLHVGLNFMFKKTKECHIATCDLDKFHANKTEAKIKRKQQQKQKQQKSDTLTVHCSPYVVENVCL